MRFPWQWWTRIGGRGTTAGLAAVAVGCVCGPQNAHAQEPVCAIDMTLVECYVAQGGQVAAEEAEARAITDLNSKSTGLAAAGFSSAISDFLPYLAGSLGFDPVNAGEEGAFALESNFGVPFGQGTGQRLRIRATLRKAHLNQKLQTAIPEDRREARVEALESTLGDLDDVEIGLAWNIESHRTGRSFRNYQVLYGRLLDDVLDEVESSVGVNDDAWIRITGLLTALGERVDLSACGENPTVGCIPADGRGEIFQALGDLADSDAAFLESAAAVVRSSSLERFSELVNGQPQVSIEARVRLQDEDLVGPTSYGVGIRYEHGFNNVNGLRNRCEDQGHPVVTIECLQEYLDRIDTDGSSEASNRIWASVGFNSLDRFSTTLPGDEVQVKMAGSWDLVFEGGFGRYLGRDARGSELGRIDLSLQGHLVDTETEIRENRVVFKADLTRQIADGASLVLGVSVANRPEFIEEESDKFRVRAGIRYGLSGN